MGDLEKNKDKLKMYDKKNIKIHTGNKTICIGNANIINSNLFSSNAVIHIIDSVMLPNCNNLYNICSSNPNSSRIYSKKTKSHSHHKQKKKSNVNSLIYNNKHLPNNFVKYKESFDTLINLI